MDDLARLRESVPAYFLFARPSFWGGAAQILDFGNTLFEYNQSESGQQADFWALRGDWMAIGQDFWEVIDAHAPDELIPA